MIIQLFSVADMLIMYAQANEKQTEQTGYLLWTAGIRQY